MFEEKILQFLIDHPRGATIVKIAREIEASPNTIRKYIKLLIEQKKVYSRKLHQYRLYYISGNELDTEQAFKNFYLWLLVLLKKYREQGEIKITEETIKKMGKEVSGKFRLEIDSSKVKKAIDEVFNRGIPDINTIRDILEGFRDYIKLYEEEMIIAGVNNLPPQKQVIIRYANVKLLVNSRDYEFHLYFLLGYIEGLFHAYHIPIKIDVKEIHSANTVEETYFDILVDYTEVLKLKNLNRK